MSQHNKATIRRIREEVVGSEDLSALDGLYASNYQYHGGTFGELTGRRRSKTSSGACPPSSRITANVYWIR